MRTDTRAIRAVYVRDMIVTARRPSMLAAIVFNVMIGTAALAAWSGVPLIPFVPGADTYAQHRFIQSTAISLILPWAIGGFLSKERRDGWHVLSVIAAAPISHLFAGRLLAFATFALLLVGSTLPMAVLAQQMSAVPVVSVVADAAASWLFAVASAIITTVIFTMSRGAITGWLASTAAVVTLRGIVGNPSLVVAGLVTIAMIALVAAVARRADRPMGMLEERRA